MGQPRILTLDIETRPAVVETWSLHNAFISIEQVREPGSILGFGYKWRGARKVGWVQTDGIASVALEARELLHQADIVVTYNGNAFDLKHLRREILLAGLTPPSPFKSIDLYRVVRANFKFQSNKLGFVAAELGVGSKASTGGYGLWRGCMAGDEAAWRKMARYCRQDVRVTEGLYDVLRPWVPNHPHVGLWIDGEAPMCHACGSHNLTRQGTRQANAVSYQRLQCQDCGAWSRGTTIERRVNGGTRAC